MPLRWAGRLSAVDGPRPHRTTTAVLRERVGHGGLRFDAPQLNFGRCATGADSDCAAKAGDLGRSVVTFGGASPGSFGRLIFAGQRSSAWV
jgi:hypothetical protein